MFSNGTSPVSFCFFSYFSNTDFKDKIVRFSEIQTLHVGVEGARTDYLTTTTAKDLFFIFNRLLLDSDLLHLYSSIDPFMRAYRTVCKRMIS